MKLFRAIGMGTAAVSIVVAGAWAVGYLLPAFLAWLAMVTGGPVVPLLFLFILCVAWTSAVAWKLGLVD